jgi:hypothetical protein
VEIAAHHSYLLEYPTMARNAHEDVVAVLGEVRERSAPAASEPLAAWACFKTELMVAAIVAAELYAGTTTENIGTASQRCIALAAGVSLSRSPQRRQRTHGEARADHAVI